MRKVIRRGAVAATLTQLAKGRHSGSWKITYRDASGKMVTGGVLRTEAKAKARAEALLDGLLADTIRDLTAEESRMITRMRAAGLTASVMEPAMKEMRETDRALVGDAVRAFLSREVDGAGYSYEQGKDYHRVLGELIGRFGNDAMTSVTTRRLEEWADGWGVGAKRWKNKRCILIVFFRWAAGRNYVLRNPAEGLPKKKLPRKKAHEVWLPKQFAKMLTACPESHIPWLVLSGHAGMRGVEIYGRPNDRTCGLQWEEIDWKRKLIVLPIRAAKQTSDSRTRLIPLTPAMEDWLSPWKKKTGPVYPPKLSPPNAGGNPLTTQLGTLVGMKWKGNALRASRASYRMAEVKNLSTVTLEMGHSEAILTGTYLNPRFVDDAKAWFALDRATAKALATEREVIRITRAG